MLANAMRAISTTAVIAVTSVCMSVAPSQVNTLPSSPCKYAGSARPRNIAANFCMSNGRPMTIRAMRSISPVNFPASATWLLSMIFDSVTASVLNISVFSRLSFSAAKKFLSTSVTRICC
ncbi:MAG: hypothetical protein BWZ07_03344 [Alphaproteobacteria bacterium ADurb.BinA280]|nr:MAG: hypothetical protein BWZ07_03344 [Alphaproteobacteria bacterium ADurb.BinA280]